jgi:hypothetical protein
MICRINPFNAEYFWETVPGDAKLEKLGKGGCLGPNEEPAKLNRDVALRAL